MLMLPTTAFQFPQRLDQCKTVSNMVLNTHSASGGTGTLSYTLDIFNKNQKIDHGLTVMADADGRLVMSGTPYMATDRAAAMFLGDAVVLNASALGLLEPQGDPEVANIGYEVFIRVTDGGESPQAQTEVMPIVIGMDDSATDDVDETKLSLWEVPSYIYTLNAQDERVTPAPP